MGRNSFITVTFLRNKNCPFNEAACSVSREAICFEKECKAAGLVSNGWCVVVQIPEKLFKFLAKATAIEKSKCIFRKLEQWRMK